MKKLLDNVSIAPIESDFSDIISKLRAADEFPIQFSGLNDQAILEKYNHGETFHEISEVLRPVEIKQIGSELLVSYFSNLANKTINLGRIESKNTEYVNEASYKSECPEYAVVITGGKKKYVGIIDHVEKVLTDAEDYKMKLVVFDSSVKGRENTSLRSSLGLELRHQGRKIVCPYCNNILKGERYCRYCNNGPIKYPGEKDNLDRLQNVADGLVKSGEAMSKTGHSMTMGCTIPILLIIIIAILIGIL
ncbi:hypothetical protein [Loigolactobacillus bifermentans]|uniref:Uncharacterized protein n=1 Tax=Loigolactobacillus bifermentans DSM 20003 TaxID=1423726 RepID=A0A0R1H5X5_9LACO|nr:hypothetical protein [Loigolactobacillus bifermentans]KRK39987.1 hypothetical protein FC07_GL001785 [Loigolactobacillus bifermentans DSM 20003]QGG59685.1 hypothetical protein LB003_03850 [Loigolactobacillus bifermentans]